MSTLSIKTASSIHQINAELWNQPSRGQPFQSHRWYAFGEHVMSDCLPAYLLAYADGALIGRASLWLVRNEPVPKVLGPLRGLVMRMIKHRPLLICRSPLSQTAGIAIAEAAPRPEILASFVENALEIAKEHHASFIIFDYLSQTDAQDWPEQFMVVSSLEPGMAMENRWTSMDEYLASAHKKDRQHYKRVLREAARLGIKLERHTSAKKIDDMLELIRRVEHDHGAVPNPWVRPMLENMQMINGELLTAKIDNRLVGCGLLLEDNDAQMTSTLGLAEDVPYVYFMLVYESLRLAFEHRVRRLRWGSGAYDVKRRLGFSFEDNNSLAFAPVSPYWQKALRAMSKRTAAG